MQNALVSLCRASRCCCFFQAEDGIRDYKVTGVQTCALPICWKGPVVASRTCQKSHLGEPMADPKGPIAFQEIGIAGILKQYRLVVPLNLREYSWTDKGVRTLLQDFAKAMSDDESEYFLGTIVTIPRSTESLEVVDGQQRLATVAILLAEIRNYLCATEELIAESIDNGFLTDIDREKRERVAKLQLNLD